MANLESGVLTILHNGNHIDIQDVSADKLSAGKHVNPVSSPAQSTLDP